MSVKRTLIITMCLLFSIASQADDAAMRKYKDYTPEQIRALPENTIKSSIPMAYTMAAQSGLAVGSELLFGMQLNLLMYPGLHDYKSAVKAYQRDLGDDPNGILTVWQIYQLDKRAGMQKLSDVIFPNQYSEHIEDDFAAVQGAITILNDKIAYPINHVKVYCYKQQLYCEYSQLELITPDDKSWSQSYIISENDSETFKISQWANDAIETKSNGSDKCRATSLSLNFKTKEFFYITRNGSGSCDFMGTDIPKLTQPRISKIIDGEKIIGDEFTRIKKAAYDVLSTEFKNKVDDLKKKSSQKQ